MCECTANIKEATQGVVDLSLQKIISEDFSSLITWAWCINSQKVIDVFKAATGLNISISDLPTLINANKLGNDLKIYKVNFVDVIKKINFSASERQNSACKYNINLPA
jgi:hypothetical protein